MMIAIHSFDMPTTGKVPDWIHLLPPSPFRGVDGRGPFSFSDPQAVIAASISAGPIPIDINHSTDLAAPTGNPSPAVGWIGRMEVRSDGVWGFVQWTGAGRKSISDREYRFISPVFRHTSDMTILSIIRAAVTNNPNLTTLVALNHTFGTASAGRGASVGGLTEIERATCRQMNLREDDFLRTKQRMASQPPAASPHGLAVTPPVVMSEEDRRICHMMGLDEGAFLREKKRLLDQSDTFSSEMTEEDRRICHMMGLDEGGFLREKKRLLAEHGAVSRNSQVLTSPEGLTEEDRYVCRMMGLAEEGFLRTKNGLAGRDAYDRFTDEELKFLRWLDIKPDQFIARAGNVPTGSDAWFEVLKEPTKVLYRSGLYRPSDDTPKARREFALSYLRRASSGG